MGGFQFIKKCSRFRIRNVRWEAMQTIFSTPYFQFKKRFYFLFVYVMNTCDYFLCLPSWHHTRYKKLYLTSVLHNTETLAQ